MSGSQSTPALNNNHSMDELYSLSSLQQVREKNLKLAELLLDSLRRNLEEKRRAQTEQKELTDAVQNSTELDTQAKESILRHLKTLKDQPCLMLSSPAWKSSDSVDLGIMEARRSERHVPVRHEYGSAYHVAIVTC
ncbi:hypothetical protein R1sor_020522 [Riccia sorocarpa]|uniref:Uncharacterized protein n=1 Tax=Riccia sorocarpa TaxID=122646 RepID=A0ABD3IJG2_9MARC